MRKKFFSIICTFAAVIMTCTVFLAGCFVGGDTSLKEYTIQYTDDAGTHTITVTDGMPYSLDVVPSRTGYDFLGLYDAEAGGTQYVAANGSSLAPFADKKNLVLFPRFKAKEYTVILDYQGAAVYGDRQFTVTYGSALPELPKNLTLEHNEFSGWYTQAGCGGTRIADQYGLIPLVSVLNEQNFDLSGTSITLYAGFELEKYTVTFYFGDESASEEMQVAYDTPIGQVVPKTRVNGNAVLTWSKTQGGEVWNGKVTGDMELYAVEYAPVIEFDSNGGDEVTPLVARAGSTVALPTPTKDLAKFSYWEDMNGNKYTATTMPSTSITLKAVWQAKLVFDENGGSDVDDISFAAGTAITLPTPEREGFIFAGWYTAEKERYTSTTMPAAGIALKAGWYAEKSNTFILLNETDTVKLSDKSLRSTSKTYSIDLNEIFEEYVTGLVIKIKLNFQFKNEYNTGYYDVTFSNSKDISTATLYWEEKLYANGNTNYQTIVRNITIQTTISALYLKFRPLPYGDEVYTTMKDLFYTIYYPDTTYLYL